MKLIGILSCLLSLTVFFSCKDKSPREIADINASELTRYQEHIADVSAGVISVNDPVVIVLQTPVAGWDGNQ